MRPSDRPTGRANALLTALLAAGLLASLFGSQLPAASGDPVIVDNLDGSLDAVWDFTSPADYTVADVAIANGRATLRTRPGSWNLTSAGDYASPQNATNVDPARFPGNVTLLLDAGPHTLATLQPGPEGEDAWIDRGTPTANFGASTTLILDGRSPQSRPLVRFNLSAIPPNAAIDAAVVSLYQTAGTGATFTGTLHRVTVPWDEDQVTWNERFTGIPWSNAGGDFDGHVFAQLSLDNAVGWRSWNVSHLVDLWYRGRVPNLGLILGGTASGPNSDKTFASSDFLTNPTQRPKLDVWYRVLGATGTYESAVGGPGTPVRWRSVAWTEASESLVADEFSGPGLDPKWAWTNPPPAWDVGTTNPGRLRIVTATGVDLDAATFTGHVLAQPVVGDFAATLAIESSPSAAGQKSGIMVLVGTRNWYAVQTTMVTSVANWQVRAVANGTGTLRSDVPGATNPAFLRIVRTGNTFAAYTSADGLAWTLRDAFAPAPEYPLAVRLAPFAADGMSGVAHTVDLDHVRVSQPTGGAVALETRTGDVPAVDGSWSPWSGPHPAPSGSPMTGSAAYVQFRISLSVASPGQVPVAGRLRLDWSDVVPTGTVETADLAPSDLRAWGNASVLDARNGQSIAYAFSLDGGAAWNPFVPPVSLATVSVAAGRIRFRATLSTADPTVSPEIVELRLSYRLALEGFEVLAPASVAAGDPFAVTVTAKGPGNATLAGWAGSVPLEAVLADGVSPGSGVLDPPAATVAAGGTVTLTNVTYTKAETIRVRAALGPATGTSRPILVSPGAVARIAVDPAVATVPPFGSADFSGSAFDAWDNPVPGTAFDWSVSGIDGRLSAPRGASVTFTANGTPGNGTLLASVGGVTGVALVSVDAGAATPWWASPFLPLALLGFGMVMAVFGQRMRWRPAKAFLVDERGELIREFTLDAGCSVTFEEVRAAGALDAVETPVKVSRYRAQAVRGDALAVVLLAYGPVSLEQVEFAREMLVNVQGRFEDRVTERLAQVRALEEDLALVSARSRGTAELMDAVVAGQSKLADAGRVLAERIAGLEARETRLAADAEALDARARRAEEAERTLGPREAELRSREAMVQERMRALDARESRIAGLEASLRDREASVTERESEVHAFVQDLEGKVKAAEEDRRALAMAKASLATERTAVAEERRRLDEEREEFETRMARMSQNALQRTEALNAQAKGLQIETERFETERREFEETRRKDIEERNRDFQNRLKIIQQKAQELLEREEDLRRREADLRELDEMLRTDS